MKKKFLFSLKFVSAFLIMLLISWQSKADVIYPFWSPNENFNARFALSLEGIGSYEFPFSKLNTIDFWGGCGFVTTNHSDYSSFGGEIAIELRQYFSKDKYKGLNIGLYSGLGYMHFPDFTGEYFNGEYISYKNSIGFVPGIKLTCKSIINSWMMCEPYLSVSRPFFSKGNIKLNEPVFLIGPVMYVTLGIRFGFNKVKKQTVK